MPVIKYEGDRDLEVLESFVKHHLKYESVNEKEKNTIMDIIIRYVHRHLSIEKRRDELQKLKNAKFSP